MVGSHQNRVDCVQEGPCVLVVRVEASVRVDFQGVVPPVAVFTVAPGNRFYVRNVSLDRVLDNRVRFLGEFELIKVGVCQRLRQKSKKEESFH